MQQPMGHRRAFAVPVQPHLLSGLPGQKRPFWLPEEAVIAQAPLQAHAGPQRMVGGIVRRSLRQGKGVWLPCCRARTDVAAAVPQPATARPYQGQPALPGLAACRLQCRRETVALRFAAAVRTARLPRQVGKSR